MNHKETNNDTIKHWIKKRLWCTLLSSSRSRHFLSFIVFSGFFWCLWVFPSLLCCSTAWFSCHTCLVPSAQLLSCSLVPLFIPLTLFSTSLHLYDTPLLVWFMFRSSFQFLCWVQCSVYLFLIIHLLGSESASCRHFHTNLLRLHQNLQVFSFSPMFIYTDLN